MRVSILFLFFLYIGISAQAQEFGFVPVDTSSAKSKIVVKDMPGVTSQDTFGICFANAAGILLDKENCRYFAQQCIKKNEKGCSTQCADMADSDRFSSLSLAHYGKIEKDEEGEVRPLPRFASGGHPANVLRVVNYLTESAASAECMSLDKLLNKIGGAKGLGIPEQLAVLDRLQSRFKKYKKLKIECGECASDIYATARDEINNKLNIQKSNDEILKAFAEKSYDEFLGKLLSPKECNRASGRTYLENSGSLDVVTFPPTPEAKEKPKKATYGEAIEKVKKVLADDRPVALANLCLDQTPPQDFKKCQYAHALVVSGYASVCDASGKCKDVIRIQNSWGKSWQDSLKVKTASGEMKSTDSWVDAKSLLDRTNYEDGFLTWFEDKPKESN